MMTDFRVVEGGGRLVDVAAAAAVAALLVETRTGVVVDGIETGEIDMLLNCAWLPFDAIITSKRARTTKRREATTRKINDENMDTNRTPMTINSIDLFISSQFWCPNLSILECMFALKFQ